MRRALIALALLLPIALAGCSHKTATAKSTGPSCNYSTTGDAAKSAQLPPAQAAPLPVGTTATIATDQGNITITLDPDKTPCTVRSFVSLAQQGYFNNTKCHRLVTSGIYVLQCGDPKGTGTGTPGYSFNDELLAQDSRLGGCQGQLCNYVAGTVAMANAGPHTNGSQFFLVFKDSPLPNNYTIFGRMDGAGLQAVQAVAAAGVGPDGIAPKTAVNISGVQVNVGPSPAPSKSHS